MSLWSPRDFAVLWLAVHSSDSNGIGFLWSLWSWLEVDADFVGCLLAGCLYIYIYRLHLLGFYGLYGIGVKSLTFWRDPEDSKGDVYARWLCNAGDGLLPREECLQRPDEEFGLLLSHLTYKVYHNRHIYQRLAFLRFGNFTYEFLNSNPGIWSTFRLARWDGGSSAGASPTARRLALSLARTASSASASMRRSFGFQVEGLGYCRLFWHRLP